MERQVAQMERLIDDLMDVGRITRNKLELRRERVELASTIYHAVEVCRPLANQAKLELNIHLSPEPLYLNADPVRLAQVFGNLLANACKFTETGGRIWLSVERQETDVVVSIKDTGIGIPQAMLPKIFEIFTQVDRSLERSQSGLGIGLTLVKRLVELHNGSVTAHSAGPNKGSEFVVRLPVFVEEPTPQEPAVSAREPNSTKGSRILVVDDNRDAATSLAMLLKMNGSEIAMAHDGAEALTQAESFNPHIILLDIGLPKMNGYDTCRSIRKQPWGEKMMIVALTGWGQDEDRRKSSEAGFNGHMVKPVDHTELMKLLAEALPRN
jgi:CheY-like chemotaxis protein